MTYTIETDEQQSIELDDYVDYVSSSVDLTDLDSVLGSADALRALANNRSFLAASVNRELADWTTFQRRNPYSAQVVFLGHGDGFQVRANMWVPPASAAVVRDREDDMFGYDTPHDHNFSFLTVGYLGPGYETDIWEYDHTRITGHPGERVELSFLEHTSLPVGKVMFYRASRDVHTQLHPTGLSVSINLIVAGPESANSQLVFDTENSTIRGFKENEVGQQRVVLCDLAGYIGDGHSVNLLENLAAGHPTPRIRWSAYEALLSLEADNAAAILNRAAADEHSQVRSNVARARE